MNIVQKLSVNNKNEILSLIKTNQNLIVIGGTDICSKGDTTSLTSKLTKYLLEDVVNGDGKTIVCTQTKRRDVLSLAELVSNENGSSVGALIGYGIRFDEKVSNETKLKFITDGLLIRELISDPLLSSYSTIIIDKINERLLRTDLLISLLNNLQKSKRPDLKLIIVSTLSTNNQAIYSLLNNNTSTTSSVVLVNDNIGISQAEGERDNATTLVEPEIEKCNLSTAILQLKALGIKSIYDDLQFITEPPKESLNEALKELYEQYGAISSPNQDCELTTTGIIMSSVPLEPCYSRMFIESNKFSSGSGNCSNEILTIISILSSGFSDDILLSSGSLPSELVIKDSDHLTLINIYNSFILNSSSEEWCIKNQINYDSMKRIQQIRDQLLQFINKLPIKLDSSPITTLSSTSNDFNNNIKKSILSGLGMNIAKLSSNDTQYYNIKTKDDQLFINSNSVLITSSPQPEYILYDTIVYSNHKKLMKCVTVIDCAWLSQ